MLRCCRALDTCRRSYHYHRYRSDLRNVQNNRERYWRLDRKCCVQPVLWGKQIDKEHIDLSGLSIQGQIIKGLYRSSNEEDWALLETDRATYELRLGGLNSTTEKRPDEFALDLPVVDKTIKTVKTDGFALYFELENGACLVHAETGVDGDGNTSFVIKLMEKTAF